MPSYIYPLLLAALLPMHARAATDFCQAIGNPVDLPAFAKANHLPKADETFHRMRGFVRETDPAFLALCSDPEQITSVNRQAEIFLNSASNGTVDCAYLKPAGRAGSPPTALALLHTQAETLVSEHDRLVALVETEEKSAGSRNRTSAGDAALSSAQKKYLGKAVPFGNGESREGGLFAEKFTLLREWIKEEHTALTATKDVAQGPAAARLCGKVRTSKWDAPASAFSTATATNTKTGAKGAATTPATTKH